MAGPVKGDLQLVAVDMNDIAHAEFLVEHPVARGKASGITLRGEGGLAASLLPGRHAAPAGAIAAALHIAELTAPGKSCLAGAAERDAAAKTLSRTREMAEKGTTSQQNLDEAVARFEGARAAVSAAEAQVAAAQAALGFARSEVVAAEAAAAAAAATVERIAADIDDCVLRSPRDGRVQYRVAQPGEVVAAGAAVLNLVDLGHVYMTFFLPTAQAGRIALGAEARIVLDAAPEFVIPASVSYVADVAQFTPKTVETADEREKLMFRIKASIDPTLLDQYLDQVKTGLPGMVYVRLDAARAWPDELQVALPP